MIVWIAYGLAVAATLLLLRHVARRYPAFPRRGPLGIGFDGRLSKRSMPRFVLWFAPAVFVVVLVVLGAALALDPPREDQQLMLALTFITIVQTAWLFAWAVDRQVEFVRKMTFRITPGRMLRAIFPLVITTALLLIVAATRS